MGKNPILKRAACNRETGHDRRKMNKAANEQAKFTKDNPSRLGQISRINQTNK
jgi:hypothetical protein